MTGSPNGTNGAGGPGDRGGAGAGQPDWASFSRSIDSMGERLGQRLTQELGTRLDGLRETVTHGFEAGQEPPPPDPNEGFDFDSATPRQLYDHMLGQFQTMVDSVLEDTLSRVLEPYAQQISGLRGDFTRDKGEREISSLQAANKDFVDFVPEMKELSKAHPSLSLTEVYRLAKASNPDKAKELDAKYNPPPPPPPRPFSLGPSHSGSTGGTGQQRQPMTKQEAARAAWEEVSARHPGVLGALEDAFPTL